LNTEQLHKIFNPFFLMAGRGNITHKYYKADYENLLNQLEMDETEPIEYAQGVFYRMWSEQYYKLIYSPKTLTSACLWNKYSIYERLKVHDCLSPVNMELLFIQRGKELISFHLVENNNFLLLPRIIPKLKTSGISLSYLVAQKWFWDILGNMDKDLKETFFDAQRLYYLKNMVYKNRKIYNFIRRLDNE
jgi:hypothetical protein